MTQTITLWNHWPVAAGDCSAVIERPAGAHEVHVTGEATGDGAATIVVEGGDDGEHFTRRAAAYVALGCPMDARLPPQARYVRLRAEGGAIITARVAWRLPSGVLATGPA